MVTPYLGYVREVVFYGIPSDLKEVLIGGYDRIVIKYQQENGYCTD